MIKAARAGGKVIAGYFGKRVSYREKKNPSDFCTAADIGSERAILKILKAAFPAYNYFSEEKGKSHTDSAYGFIIDPLDGNNNFIMGVPNFSVSIALVKDGTILGGVVYQPMLDLLYRAAKGHGAFCNSKRIHVNAVSNPKRATVSFSCDYKSLWETEIKTFRKLTLGLDIKRFLINWSPAIELCMVASGSLEAVFIHENEAYDFAAGKLIVREAGGAVLLKNSRTDKDDLNNKFLACNATSLSRKLLRVFP
jgi:myo-inositol-1(or 4)-monophosphatase